MRAINYALGAPARARHRPDPGPAKILPGLAVRLDQADRKLERQPVRGRARIFASSLFFP